MILISTLKPENKCPRDSDAEDMERNSENHVGKVPLLSEFHEVKGIVQYCPPLYLQGLSPYLTHGQDSKIFVKGKKGHF